MIVIISLSILLFVGIFGTIDMCRQMKKIVDKVDM